MREAEEDEEEKECEGGKKCVKERMKHVRGVNNNRTKYVSWPMDMTLSYPVLCAKHEYEVSSPEFGKNCTILGGKIYSQYVG